MKNLSTALDGVFTATDAGVHNDFYNDIQGRLFKGRAPEGIQYPYAVYTLIAVSPFRTFTEHFEDPLIQFSLFSSTSSTSEVEDMFTHLKELYDESQFDITENDLIWMRYANAQLIPDAVTTPEGTFDVWHYAVDFEIKLQSQVYVTGAEIDWIGGILWDDGFV